MKKWIRFDLLGMVFKLKIYGYIDEQEWLKTSFRFKFKDIIEYKADNIEIFTGECVHLLIEHLDSLLNDRFESEETLGFFEPDFEFVFKPKYVIDTEDGGWPQDISVELRVNLWHGGLTTNYFSMTFERNDIRRLYDYLIEVVNDKDEEERLQQI